MHHTVKSCDLSWYYKGWLAGLSIFRVHRRGTLCVPPQPTVPVRDLWNVKWHALRRLSLSHDFINKNSSSSYLIIWLEIFFFWLVVCAMSIRHTSPHFNYINPLWTQKDCTGILSHHPDNREHWFFFIVNIVVCIYSLECESRCIKVLLLTRLVDEATSADEQLLQQLHKSEKGQKTTRKKEK